MEAIDAESGEMASLYDPRRDRWSDHFTWSEDTMLLSTKPLRVLSRSIAERLTTLVSERLIWAPSARRIVALFREAAALTPMAAQPFHARSPVEERMFVQLLHAGVLRQPVRGRYYLDEGSLAELRRRGLLPW